MGLVHFRVDDRLVHGIVAGYWTNHLQATRIMVIDNKASEDDMVRASLRMATPQSVSLSVLTIDKAINNIKNGNYETQRVFVISKSPTVFEKLQENGIKVPEINMGNITYSEGRLRVAKTVSLNNEEIKALENLSSNGTKIISRLVPDDKSEDFMAMLKEARK